MRILRRYLTAFIIFTILLAIFLLTSTLTYFFGEIDGGTFMRGYGILFHLIVIAFLIPHSIQYSSPVNISVHVLCYLCLIVSLISLFIITEVEFYLLISAPQLVWLLELFFVILPAKSRQEKEKAAGKLVSG